MDDLISRQAAIDAIGNDIMGGLNYRRILLGLPSAQEQKKGKWIPTHERSPLSHPDSITYVCSECGNKVYTIYGVPKTTKFCWECGAEMKGEQDESS